MTDSFKTRLVQWITTYYLALAGVVFILGLPKFARVSSQLAPTLEWGQVFLSLVTFKSLALLIATLTILFAIISAFLFRFQILRVALFLSLFYFESLFNSIGAKTHLFQFWLWSSLALALIPTLNASLRRRDFWHLRLGIWCSISTILLFYFLSGFWKTIGLLQQLYRGETHFLSQQGLIYHIYSEILRASARPLAQQFVTEHAWINPFLSFGVLLLQLVCIVGIWRSGYHRIIGFGLLAFHFGTFLILDVNYPSNFILVLFAVLLSPFPKKT